MSVRKLRLELSSKAREDYSDILLYTEREWGRRQRAAYNALIDRVLRRLTEYP